MEQKQQADICIFTIVSNNYLHYANTLFESLQLHCPQAHLVLGLCDIETAQTDCQAAHDIISVRELAIPCLGAFIYQYTILELNTAIKPFIIEALFSRGYRKVIYFDPDIMVMRSLEEMLGLLDQHKVVLTPHLTDILDDGKLPGELQILQAGSYNLGYIGLQACDETRRLIKWWQQKLYRDCVVDIPRGLFVDQKWMDLVPSMFDGVYINRDPSWNVAYWNLNHRALSLDVDGIFTVNGRPLTFFHFSGYSIQASTLSKHQNRLEKGSAGSPLQRLCSLYDRALLRNGLERFHALPYAFSQFADGTPVPDSARRVIRTVQKLRDTDFFDPSQCTTIHTELNRPVISRAGRIPLTALAMALWESRKDLADAFPAVESIDGIRFAKWLVDTAPREAAFSEVYISPIQRALATTAAVGGTRAPDSSFFSRVLSGLVRFAWQHRERIPLKLRLAVPAVGNWALRRAYPDHVLHEHVAAIPVSHDPGINLIGYLSAESGVGEAARASLRALRECSLPFSLLDYRLGNLSRMGELIEDKVPDIRYPINLMHVNADQCKIARDHLGSELFADRYTIGYWYWEMPEFPEFLHFAYDQVDEVWVATEYNRKSIAKHTDKPVRVIPPAIELKIDKRLNRADLHMPEDAFIFLHMSDVLSVPERKNPVGVVHAFLLAFGDHPEANVKLVVKLSNLDYQPALSEEIFGLMERDPRIQLIHDYLDRNTLNNLLSTCDCYVSLHRAEGFGLPIAEAMYLGKPVIATNWSGNVDMMNATNSLPVRYRMVTLEKDIGPYGKGQQWAEPDIEDAAEHMRSLVCSSSERVAEIGEQAKCMIRDRYSPAATAAKIDAGVLEIMAGREALISGAR